MDDPQTRTLRSSRAPLQSHACTSRGRLAEVHAARTRGDLEQAFRQLPRSEPPASLRVRDLRWSSLALQYGLVNLVCILVWLFSGAQGASGPSGSSSAVEIGDWSPVVVRTLLVPGCDGAGEQASGA